MIRLKKITIMFFLFSVSLILSLVISELILRRIYKKKNIKSPWQTTSRYLIDDKLIYTLRPNNYSEWKTTEFIEKATTNNYGFRNTYDISYDKPSTTYRIIVTGDSFTFGHGLEDQNTYPAKLENLLNQNGKDGKKFEVINAGVPGYSPDQQYRQITEKLIHFSPDLLLWNIIPADIFYDLIETAPALYEVTNGNQLKALNPKLNWLYLQIYLFLNTPEWIKNTYLFDLVSNKLPEIKFLRRKPNLPYSEMIKWAENKLLLEIESIDKLSKEKKFIFTIIILPDKESFKENKNLNSNLSIDVFNTIIQKLHKGNIFVYDLKSNFPKDYILEVDKSLRLPIYPSHNLFFREDSHPNKLGTSVFADLIAKYLYKNLLITL